MQGYWSGLGTPSVVDWCEPNYVVTPYVAEFWNTLSSLVMVAFGLVGLVWWWRHRARVARRFAWGFAGLALVGVGSAAFHGTLLRGPQALDELPMVYVGLLGAWMLRNRARPRHEGVALAVAMAVYAVLFTATYAFATTYFLIFLVSYSVLVAYMALGSAMITWVRKAPQLQSVLLIMAAVTFFGATFLFWIPEHVLLGCDHPLQALHLHSWWHLGAGSGTYAWFLWAIVDRWRHDGVEARWAGWSIAPREG